MRIESFLKDSEPTRCSPDELIPEDYRYIYGMWELFDISGGIGGSGYEHDSDYLEIKNFGIYGVIRNDTLIEYGCSEIVEEAHHPYKLLTIQFHPEYQALNGTLFLSLFD
ncbi:MAG: hypothetical protein R2751_15865 [Bacteroidales bacterium]